MQQREIRHTVFIGMGALGLLYGNFIRKNLGKESITFLMDEKRYERHVKDVYTINGEKVDFQIETPANAKPADLVVFATKFGALQDAIREAQPVIRDHTIIVSILNGIVSEDIIGSVYGMKHVVDSVSLGMDAMRDGTTLHYSRAGRLQIGVRGEEDPEALKTLAAFFDHAGVPYEVVSDIRRAMWKKYMINIGTNQTCTVYSTNYGGSMTGEALADQRAAMEETVRIAQAEGVGLTEQDVDDGFAILKTLDQSGYPSMRQDVLAKRKTEVDLFAGTIIRLGKKHGIPTPVNEKYYKIIKDIESRY